MNQADIIDAHRFSANNQEMLKRDRTCGCFFCKEIFEPKEITEWIDDENGATAICPYCMIDSIISESSGYPITKEFLEAMSQYWFYNDEHPKELKFDGIIQELRLMSNRVSFGPSPDPDEEAKQYLSITADGEVRFSAYQFGNLLGEPSRKLAYPIDPMDAQDLLENIAIFFTPSQMHHRTLLHPLPITVSTS